MISQQDCILFDCSNVSALSTSVCPPLNYLHVANTEEHTTRRKLSQAKDFTKIQFESRETCQAQVHEGSVSGQEHLSLPALHRSLQQGVHHLHVSLQHSNNSKTSETQTNVEKDSH